MKITAGPGLSASSFGTWLNASGTATGSVVLGTTGNVGIGTATPTEKLELIGKMKVVDGSQGTGKVLTSDANGVATWKDPEQTLPIGSVMSFNGTSCPA